MATPKDGPRVSYRPHLRGIRFPDRPPSNITNFIIDGHCVVLLIALGVDRIEFRRGGGEEVSNWPFLGVGGRRSSFVSVRTSPTAAITQSPPVEGQRLPLLLAVAGGGGGEKRSTLETFFLAGVRG